jgi:two-component system sensor histidine kinase ChvG
MASMPAKAGVIGTPADEVLDRTAEIARAATEARISTEVEAQIAADGLDTAAARPRLHGLARVGDWLRRAWQFFITQSFSSLTRRIVFLNVAGLLALSIGITFLSQFRAGLIDARVQSLLVQGQIIAGAIAASATVETDSSITIDPDKLLDLRAGESYGPSEDALYGIDFPINPERVAPVLRRLVSPTKTRARIYDRDGVLLVDSRNLFGRGDVLRYDLPAPYVE